MSVVETQLELVQSKTLASLAQSEIVRMIRDGEVLAGAKLQEVSLTSRLNISRAAVREAFRGLEEAGLVRLEKNRGVFVREFSKIEAVELYELRTCLEEMAGRRLADTVTTEQIDELSKINQRLGTLAKKSAINQYYPINIAFHDRFVTLSRNTVLLETYRRLIDQMHLLRRRGYETGDGLIKSHSEHSLIIDALAKRDPETIALAIRAHSLNGMARFLAL